MLIKNSLIHVRNREVGLVFKVITPGIQVTVQDYPGRVGYAHLGFPRSGAMDDLALRIGNRIVGNKEGEAGIEFAFKGPKLEFMEDCLISITGGNCSPTIDGKELPMWTAVRANKGQILDFAYTMEGVWSYICLSGGIDVPEVMGSKSTFTNVNIGGYKGRQLEAGDVISLGNFEKPLLNQLEGRKLRNHLVPEYKQTMEVELMYGSHYDWLSENDIEKMTTNNWKVSINSNRLGYRLEGPEFEFSEKALKKPKECGSHPSNIFDTGYYLGGINLAGQTPVVLTADGPTAGGYIQPFIVPKVSLWKVGQSKFGNFIRFRLINIEEAIELNEKAKQYFEEDSYC